MNGWGHNIVTNIWNFYYSILFVRVQPNYFLCSMTLLRYPTIFPPTIIVIIGAWRSWFARLQHLP